MELTVETAELPPMVAPVTPEPIADEDTDAAPVTNRKRRR